jgi:hypothetical protein
MILFTTRLKISRPDTELMAALMIGSLLNLMALSQVQANTIIIPPLGRERATQWVEERLGMMIMESLGLELTSLSSI